MDESQRRSVVGLHPDRAPTIVAGMILLSEAMRAFDLDEVEVSEHDILHGGALLAAPAPARRGSQARLDLRGYTTVGSVSTFTSAGSPALNARSSAGRDIPRALHQLAVPAERLHDLVVAGPRP